MKNVLVGIFLILLAGVSVSVNAADSKLCSVLLSPKKLAIEIPDGKDMMFKWFSQYGYKKQEIWRKFIRDVSRDNWESKRKLLQKGLYKSMGIDAGWKPNISIKHYGTVPVGSIKIEKIAIRHSPGLYVNSNLYVPESFSKPLPGILFLPGHGNPLYSMHHDALALASSGYVVLVVESYGCGGTSENPEVIRYRSVYHGGAPAAPLLILGKTLLGLETMNHIAALEYLRKRSDICLSNRIGVTGASGGATHTLWTMSIDDRVEAGAFVSALEENHPDYYMRHCCLCDVGIDILPNLYWAPFVELLCAPRPLLRVFPGDEVPAPRNLYRRYYMGELSYNDLLKKKLSLDSLYDDYFGQITQLYAKLGRKDNWRIYIAKKGHTFSHSIAAVVGFFNKYLKSRGDGSPVGNIPSSKGLSRAKAIELLTCFPDKSSWPKDLLSPSEYIKNSVKEKISKLSGAPETLAKWRSQSEKIKIGLRKCLRIKEYCKNVRFKKVGDVTVDGFRADKFLLKYPDQIMLPVVVISPSSPDKSSLVKIYLHPAGYEKFLVNKQNKILVQQALGKGQTVVLTDLRGIGRSRPRGEWASYLNLRDHDMAIGALRSERTIAGLWMQDLLSVINFVDSLDKEPTNFAIYGWREMGFVACCAAVFDEKIYSLELYEPLITYYSPGGYGKAYIFKGDNTNLGGYGSVAPFLPDILSYADVPMILALVAPRQIKIINPVWASGKRIEREEASEILKFSYKVYSLYKCSRDLSIRFTQAKFRARH